MAETRKTMEAQAARIEDVFATHNLRVHVVRGSLTPRAIHFDLKTVGEVRIETVAPLAAELARATGSRDATVHQHEGLLRIALPRGTVEPVRLLGLTAQLLSAPPPGTALLGVDGHGAPLLLRLSAANVGNVLIAGMTGAGKTALARTLLTSLVMHNPPSHLQLVLVDPKKRGFAALQSLPHVVGTLVSTPDEALACCHWAAEELVRRERTTQAGATSLTHPLMVLLIDELADLLQAGGKRLSTLIAQIARRGRSVGIHLVACTQKPTAALIGSELKATFPVRLVGAVASSEEARYATDLSDSGAESLGGRGDFLLVTGGQSVRFQAAWLGRKELDAIAARLHAAGAEPVHWPDFVRPAPPPVVDSAASPAPLPFQREYQLQQQPPQPGGFLRRLLGLL